MSKESNNADSKTAIEELLDDWHKAASEPNPDRYFGYMAPGAIFMGTDSWEIWTREEFEERYRPIMEEGRSWNFQAFERDIFLAPNEDMAWFHERLNSDKMGEVRGSGVLMKQAKTGDSSWLIVQYNLAMPIPNEIVYDVKDQIDEWKSQSKPESSSNP